MGEEQSLVSNESPVSSATVRLKHAKLSYSREFLLSLRALESCSKQPSGLDPLVLREPRDRSCAYAMEGGIAVSTIPGRGLVCRGKNGDGSPEAVHEILEWRRTPGNVGSPVASQCSGRIEHGGGSFKSVSIYGENNHPRSNYDKSGWQGIGLAGGEGRWGHRSRVIAKDVDSLHYDRDVLGQDSGMRSYGTGSQYWQASIPSQRDGLLGSGGSLRSSGSSGGSTHLNIQGHDRQHAVGHMNRTSEPYIPPHSLKINHSRREAKDSFNAETFGSDEISSQEKSEQEKTRRESFELMRKEQQKVLQEKQKHIVQKHDEWCMPELNMSSDKKPCQKSLWEDGQRSGVHATPLNLHAQPKSAAPIRVSLLSVVPTSSRPLVPPGFGKAFLEKQAYVKATNAEAILEVGETTGEEKDPPMVAPVNAPLDGDKGNQANKGVRGNWVKEGQSTMSTDDVNEQEFKAVSQETSFGSTLPGNLEVELLGSEISHFQTVGGLDTDSNTMESNKIASLPGTRQDIWSVGLDDVEIESKGIKESQLSILDELFGKASAEVDGGDAPVPIESHIVNGGDDTWARENSKFARWFHKEEDKPKDDTSSLEASDILSLLAKSEKGTPPTSDASEERSAVLDMPNDSLSPIISFQNPGRILPMPVGPLLEDIEKVMTSAACANIHDSADKLKSSDSHSSDSLGLETKVDVYPNNHLYSKDYQHSMLNMQQVVLTCEDLEQSIIAEASGNVPKLQMPSEEIQNVSLENNLTSEQKLCIDNHASQHLLSLLHKGSNPKDQCQSVIQGLDDECIGTSKDKYIGSSKVSEFGETTFGSCLARHNAEEVEGCEKTDTMQTLEALFGKAFMKELHSVEAPVSVKAVSNDRAFSDKSDRLEVLFDALSMNRQNSCPVEDFETAIQKANSFPASTKASDNEDKILQMHQSLSVEIASVPDRELISMSSELTHGIRRSNGDSESENAKIVGSGYIHHSRTGAEIVSSPVENGVHRSKLASDFGNERLRVTSGFWIVEDSITGGPFESSIKEHRSDVSSMHYRHSSMGQDDTFVCAELPAEESLIDVGNSKSNESSKFMSIIEVTDMSNRITSDDFVSSEINGIAPEMIQKLATFKKEDYLKDGKRSQDDHGTGAHVMDNKWYWGADLPIPESKTSLTEMMRRSLEVKNDSVSRPSLSSRNNEVAQLFGLSSRSYSSSPQHWQMPTDLPLKSYALPGQNAKPPSSFSPYHYGGQPYDLNSRGFNALSQQQLNPHQALVNNQQINYINHDSSLEPQILGFGHCSDPLFGRSFSQEPSRHMTYPFVNVGPMSQSAYHPMLPPGHAPSNFMQTVRMPHGGLNFPSLNNIHLTPERLPQVPQDFSSNQVPQVPGAFVLNNSSLQGAPFHHQPILNIHGQAVINSKYQSIRSDFGISAGFSAPVGPVFDASGYVGAMSDNGAVVDRRFDMKPRTSFGGTLSATQYPLPLHGLETGTHSGYK